MGGELFYQARVNHLQVGKKRKLVVEITHKILDGLRRDALQAEVALDDGIVFGIQIRLGEAVAAPPAQEVPGFNPAEARDPARNCRLLTYGSPLGNVVALETTVRLETKLIFLNWFDVGAKLLGQNVHFFGGDFLQNDIQRYSG